MGGGGGYGGYREGSFRMREIHEESKNVYLSFFTLYNKFTAAASTRDEIYVLHIRVFVDYRCIARLYERKGKGRPVITKVMIVFMCTARK